MISRVETTWRIGAGLAVVATAQTLYLARYLMKVSGLGTLVIAAMLCVMTGCDDDVAATAVPPRDGLLVAGAYGLVNTPHMKLGDIVAINRSPDNRTNKQVYRIATINADTVKKHTQAPNALGDISTGFSRSLDVGFSASLDKQVEIALKLLISSATEMKVTNSKRIQLDNVPDALSDDASALASIVKHPNASKLHFFVVQAVIAADKFEVGLRKDLQSETSVNVFKFGKYKLTVNYTNKEWTTVTANGNALFFKVSPVAVTAAGQPFIDTSVNEAPEEFSWIETN